MAERQGKVEQALTQLAESAGSQPAFAFEVHRQQVAILERAGRSQEALDLLNYDLTYRPYDVELLLSRGALHEKLGQLDPALADLRAAVAVMPDNPLTLNALGYTLANRTGRHTEAYRLIRRALERDPANPAILDSYGWAWYRLGRLPEARSYLQLAYSGLPDPEVAAHLGEVMWEQGEREAARRLWQEALERSPQSEPLRDTMSRFLPGQRVDEGQGS
jgi:Flp pilus assembly protein TadD